MLENVRLLQRRVDTTKAQTFVFANRGVLAHFIEFFAGMAQTFTPLKPYYTDDAIALFGAMVDTALDSGYETLNLTFSSVKAAGNEKGLNTAGWAQAMSEISTIPDLKIAKSGNDVSVRIYVKDHKQQLHYLRIIQAFKTAKLC